MIYVKKRFVLNSWFGRPMTHHRLMTSQSQGIGFAIFLFYPSAIDLFPKETICSWLGVGPYKKRTFDFPQKLIETSSGDFKQVSEDFQGFSWLGRVWWTFESPEKTPHNHKKFVKHHQVTSTPETLRKLTWNHLTIKGVVVEILDVESRFKDHSWTQRGRLPL